MVHSGLASFLGGLFGGGNAGVQGRSAGPGLRTRSLGAGRTTGATGRTVAPGEGGPVLSAGAPQRSTTAQPSPPPDSGVPPDPNSGLQSVGVSRPSVGRDVSPRAGTIQRPPQGEEQGGETKGIPTSADVRANYPDADPVFINDVILRAGGKSNFSSFSLPVRSPFSGGVDIYRFNPDDPQELTFTDPRTGMMLSMDIANALLDNPLDSFMTKAFRLDANGKPTSEEIVRLSDPTGELFGFIPGTDTPKVVAFNDSQKTEEMLFPEPFVDPWQEILSSPQAFMDFYTLGMQGGPGGGGEPGPANAGVYEGAPLPGTPSGTDLDFGMTGGGGGGGFGNFGGMQGLFEILRLLQGSGMSSSPLGGA